MTTTLLTSFTRLAHQEHISLHSATRHHGKGSHHTAGPRSSETGRRSGRVLLNTRNSLLLICPLLPTEAPKHALSMPEEVWRRILEFVIQDLMLVNDAKMASKERMNLLGVCKTFKSVASPMFYGHPTLTTQYALTSFRDTLTAADARWDELRRIPYSTPGRWVISLDISTITTPTTKARLAIDTALTQIFPVTPFLAELSLHPTNILSRRALKSLKESCGMRLRSIKGLGIRDVDPFLSATAREDPVTDLLTCTPNLEILHVVGQGFADIDDEQPDQQTTTTGTPPVLSLSLEHLHELSLIATPISQVFITLLDTPLPALRSLTLTSYHSEAVDEQILAAQALGLPVPDGGPGLIGGFPGPQPTFPIPATNNGTNDPSTPSFTSLFLKTHGQGLHKLTLVSAPDWPPMPFTPPRDLLITSPHLFHLFLIMEKNTGSLGSPQLHLDAPPKPHPLRTISLTRPNEALLSSLEVALRTTVTPPKQPMATTAANQNGLTLAQALRATGPSTIYLRGGSRLASPIANTRQTSLFPSLSTVKFTSVRWLKLTSRGALNAGTSGGMRQWKSVLRRYGVRVLDMDNAEA